VEFNWNAITDFLETEELGLADIDDLRTLKPSKITALIYAAVKEGARMQKKDFPFSVKDFGAVIGVAEVTAMFQIFRAQTAVNNPSKKKRMKLLLNRFQSTGS